ncbi:MAG: alkaline phosphatase family protein [Chloroflexi bacterium]|nr:alkaline phosphatase family protein [Chloroflexota bacterium]MCI0580106.1 alkaline phosphatase family protein [Chloroflexota bacterium]MCI0649318.1 alkaline phosphatase family protein [Chloroflexota bacterium]MCI0725949.1 alkaline phosphatase family protein [Chloroflexota bacterium]
MLKKLFGRKKEPKVFVIGLDCAPPELIFQAWRNELPNLKRLLDGGAYSEMYSSTPAITVPAWASMTSSKDPGVLGFYGFRNRSDYTYDNRYIATSLSVKEKRVWDILGEAGKQCIVAGVPQTYPVKPVNGYLISSFLTPSTTNPNIQWTHPVTLRPEIERLLAPEVYDVDVPQFRTEDKAFLLKQIYDMTRKRFKVLRYLLEEKPWDFFMFVEMGVDRIHHGMWAHHDPTHHKHDPNTPFLNAIKEYYVYLDQEIGTLLERLPADTHIIVVSDHGVKRMDGGICINEWLRRQGHLTLLEEPPEGRLSSFEKVEVEWSKSAAWGDGGYYGRVFLNVAGREPAGIIPPGEYESFRDSLAEEIRNIPAPDGTPLHNVVFKPQEIYQEVRGVAPDLIVYFDNLGWRSVGSLGHHDVYTFENDTGPDDANHAENGIYIYTTPDYSLGGKRLPDTQLMDFTPTVLNLFGLPGQPGMQGKIIEH